MCGLVRTAKHHDRGGKVFEYSIGPGRVYRPAPRSARTRIV